MALAISLLTISSVSFLIAAFMHNFAYGLFWSTLLHVVHFMVFGSGYILPFEQVWTNYFWSGLLFALAGWILAVMLKIPAFLNGAYYGQVFDSEFAKKKGVTYTSESGDKWKTFGKFLVTILIIAVAHIVYELNVSGFPKWGGGIVLFVLDIVAWIVFYFLFRSDEKTVLFNSSDPKAEVRTIMFNMIVLQSIYNLTYFIFQAVDCPNWSSNSPNVYAGDECALFYDKQWYFWVSLIVGGFALIWAIAVGMYARGRSPGGDEDVNASYKPLKAQA